MASPHVAGVAAALKATGIKDPDQLTEVLLRSAHPVQDDSQNYFGAGTLDAGAALNLKPSGLPSFPLLGEGFWGDRLWFDFDGLRRYDKLLCLGATIILATVLGSLRPFTWNVWFLTGLLLGSTGLFLIRDLYVFDLPQWPLRLLGSSIPELGGVFQATNTLNPIFASVLIPFLLVILLLGHQELKWFAIGSTIGVAAALAVSAVIHPHLVWLGSGWIARAYLAVNAVLCLGLANLAVRAALDEFEDRLTD
jgi:serine protease